MNGIEPISIIFQQTTCMFNTLCWTREGHCICWSADVELCVTGLEHTPSLFWQLLKWIVWNLIVKRKFWVYPKVKGFDRTNLTPVTYAWMLLLPWCHIASVAIFFVSGTLASLWKQPFLLAPCHWDILQEGTSATQWQKFHTDDIKSVLNSVRSADWTTK